jgi:hypothetical protein
VFLPGVFVRGAYAFNLQDDLRFPQAPLRVLTRLLR